MGVVSKIVRQKSSWVFEAALQNNPLLCLGLLGKCVFLKQGPIMRRTHYLWPDPNVGTASPLTHTHTGGTPEGGDGTNRNVVPVLSEKAKPNTLRGLGEGVGETCPERYPLMAWDIYTLWAGEGESVCVCACVCVCVLWNGDGSVMLCG